MGPANREGKYGRETALRSPAEGLQKQPRQRVHSGSSLCNCSSVVVLRLTCLIDTAQMGNEDLAKHLESMGELAHAYEVYAKMRSDASTTDHIVKGNLHLARLSVYRREWNAVITHVNKINGVSNASNTKDKDGNASDNGEQKTVRNLCLILYGIAQLGQGKYSDAASTFLRVDSSMEASFYDEFASPNDIATYGGLLALATMDRSELSKFLDHSTFRSFLELEPHLRRAMSQFVSGRYSACLSILDNYRSDYLLDIYLQPHTAKVFSMIRAKCIHHFLQPFSCVTIESMNDAFAQPGQSMETELVEMIRSGKLEARIDTIDKVRDLHGLSYSSRSLAESSSSTGSDYDKCKPSSSDAGESSHSCQGLRTGGSGPFTSHRNPFCRA